MNRPALPSAALPAADLERVAELGRRRLESGEVVHNRRERRELRAAQGEPRSSRNHRRGLPRGVQTTLELPVDGLLGGLALSKIRGRPLSQPARARLAAAIRRELGRSGEIARCGVNGRALEYLVGLLVGAWVHGATMCRTSESLSASLVGHAGMYVTADGGLACVWPRARGLGPDTVDDAVAALRRAAILVVTGVQRRIGRFGWFLTRRTMLPSDALVRALQPLLVELLDERRWRRGGTAPPENGTRSTTASTGASVLSPERGTAGVGSSLRSQAGPSAGDSPPG